MNKFILRSLLLQNIYYITVGIFFICTYLLGMYFSSFLILLISLIVNQYIKSEYFAIIYCFTWCSGWHAHLVISRIRVRIRLAAIHMVDHSILNFVLWTSRKRMILNFWWQMISTLWRRVGIIITKFYKLLHKFYF